MKLDAVWRFLLLVLKKVLFLFYLVYCVVFCTEQEHRVFVDIGGNIIGYRWVHISEYFSSIATG